MTRLTFLFLLTFAFAPVLAMDDGPPISITSPDEASTYVFAVLKNHSLVWSAKSHELIARLIFAEVDQEGGSANDDAHDFRLPGVNLDPAKGLFFATSPKGEIIPVARFKTVLFMKTVQTLPNAVVRVVRNKGQVSVILEAINPNDPAMHPRPGAAVPSTEDPDGTHTHTLDIDQILH